MTFIGSPTVLVAGVGNLFLGDDGFGCEVAARLEARRLPHGVVARDFGIRGFDLAHALAGGLAAAILVDAAPRGEPPGTLTVLEAVIPDGLGPDDAPEELIDTHGMDPVHVLRLARALGGTPERVLVVALEPLPMDLGPDDEPVEEWIGLSDAATAAVETAVAIVERLIDEFMAGVAPDGKGTRNGHREGADRPGSPEPVERRDADARHGVGRRPRSVRGDRRGDGRQVDAGNPALSPGEADVTRHA